MRLRIIADVHLLAPRRTVSVLDVQRASQPPRNYHRSINATNPHPRVNNNTRRAVTSATLGCRGGISIV